MAHAEADHRMISMLRQSVALGRKYVTSPRYGVMIIIVVISFIAWDKLFPFSSFPMYGNFPDRTYYVYIADGNGEPLPLHDLYGYRTTILKRIYNRKMKGIVEAMEKEGEDPELHLLTAEQLRPAGDATLQWLVENDRRAKRKGGAPPSDLQLVQVDVELQGRELVKRRRVVGVFKGGNR